MKHRLLTGFIIAMMMLLAGLGMATVTPNPASYIRYTGDNTQATFPYTFKIYTNTDLQVIVTDIAGDHLKALTTDYTVTGVGNPTFGNVVFTTPPASGSTITIALNLPIKQDLHYIPNAPFPAASSETALDRLTMELQQVVDRSLFFNSRKPGVNLTFPAPSLNGLIGWNSTGTALQTYPNLTSVSVPNIDYLGNYENSLATAVATIGSAPTLLQVTQGVAVSDNLIVSANITLWPTSNGVITISSGKTLYINGPFEAGNYQVFSGPGKVQFGPGSIKAVNPQWFGAKADGVTDSSAAFQAAFDSLPLGLTHGWSFLIPPGVYYLPTTINLPGISLSYDGGVNMAPCYILGYGATLYTDQANTILKRWPTNDTTDPNAYASTAFIVDGIQFRGTGLRDQIGLDLACTYVPKIMNCRFVSLGRGLRLSYAMLPEITECMANDCMVAGFTETDGYGLWSTVHTWSSTGAKYRHCRVYPSTALTPVSIGGMTAAASCVVTWTGHGLQTGDIVFIDGITQLNWTALNKRRFQITRIGADSFSLKLLDRTDTPAAMDTSTFGAYVPATGGGVIHAARFGFQFVNSNGPTLESPYIEAGNITDSVFFYHYTYGGFSLTGGMAQELTPLGAGVYLNNLASSVSLDGLNGDGVTLDMFDISTAQQGLVMLNGYSTSGGTIRLPNDDVNAGYRIAFKGGGVLGTGREFLNPIYWFQGTVPFRVSNYYDNGNPMLQGGDVLLQGGRGTFVSQEAFFGTAYYSGANYQGLRSEGNTAGGGGVGAYDTTNGQAIMVKQKSTEVTVTAGATNTVTNFIPAGVMVVGFTARVIEVLSSGGAIATWTLTEGANTWLTGVSKSLNATATLANTSMTAPKIYASATSVVITPNASFDGVTGKIRLTVHYITLEAPGS